MARAHHPPASATSVLGLQVAPPRLASAFTFLISNNWHTTTRFPCLLTWDHTLCYGKFYPSPTGRTSHHFTDEERGWEETSTQAKGPTPTPEHMQVALSLWRWDHSAQCPPQPAVFPTISMAVRAASLGLTDPGAQEVPMGPGIPRPESRRNCKNPLPGDRPTGWVQQHHMTGRCPVGESGVSGS
jgi:hypothetical protein